MIILPADIKHDNNIRTIYVNVYSTFNKEIKFVLVI